MVTRSHLFIPTVADGTIDRVSGSGRGNGYFVSKGWTAEYAGDQTYIIRLYQTIGGKVSCDSKIGS